MKNVLKFCGYAFAGVALLAITLVAPIDDMPLHEQPFYQRMVAQMDTLQLTRHVGVSKLKVGWSEFNITPSYPMPMAGYTPKDQFEDVHDSLFCRILSIDNGSSRAYIISMDLMLFPPTIKNRLQAILKKSGSNDFLYFTATHTHSSVGGWDDSIVGRFTIGKFQPAWVDTTVDQIIHHMQVAATTAKHSGLSYWESDAHELVENRLDRASPSDGLVRGLEFVRDDSSKAVIAAFSGHPTNIELLGRTLSGDYPATLVKEFKKRGYDFGMFMAGMVGSHRIKGFEGEQYSKIESIGKTLAAKFDSAQRDVFLSENVEVASAHVPIPFGPSQLHFEKGWKARDWAFRSLIGGLQGELSYLSLGNIIFIGTPCDFSGELWVEAEWQKWCRDHHKHIIITSFNGNYTGYITADHHYGKKEEEVLALNWVGPYFGAYFKEMISRTLGK